MSRDRFLLIMRCLHFARNPGEDDRQPEDRLFKIKPLIVYFNNKMEEIYYTDKNLSLDLWRGRLSFRQYIKNKRHKYGIKLYVLTEPDGTILKFAVYTGQLHDFGGKGHAANVVLHLMEGLLDVGQAVYMDSYYNSYDLATKLLRRQTYYTYLLLFQLR
ncbi:piggyBac transposable element-derived protein 4-like [Agrilus planipennis]|uniref:PiggyBac transposable element-derived protein 4-like n=1 Tax=Agrilus planipennis TaxID=224129 RepID=A0A7F5R4N4_AGRPL|nr:piggyBac transposable element-derived protein 4-like [Agrilus planipennis]